MSGGERLEQGHDVWDYTELATACLVEDPNAEVWVIFGRNCEKIVMQGDERTIWV